MIGSVFFGRFLTEMCGGGALLCRVLVEGGTLFSVYLRGVSFHFLFSGFFRFLIEVEVP